MDDKEEQFEKWWNSKESEGSKFWPDDRHKKLAFKCWLAGYESGHEEGYSSGYDSGNYDGFDSGYYQGIETERDRHE